MTERQLNTLFGKYLINHPREDCETYELKRVLAKSFNPHTVQPHQLKGLLDSLEGMYNRIPDQPWVDGGHQKKKPFDCLWIKAKRAYVVPIFYQPRLFKKVFLIPVKEFLKVTKSIKMETLETMGFESFYL